MTANIVLNVSDVRVCYVSENIVDAASYLEKIQRLVPHSVYKLVSLPFRQDYGNRNTSSQVRE